MVAVAVLLVGLLSGWLPATEAVLLNVPAAVGVRTTVIVSLAPCDRKSVASGKRVALGGRGLTLKKMAETNVALAGSTSVIVTPVALLVVSLLVTTIV